MYTYQEQCMINLGNSYSLLYGFIGRRLLECYGEEGERALREGTRRFGIDRATNTRNKHLQVGAKINMKNLFTLYHDLPPDPRFRRELQDLNPRERVSHTLVCPMADIWKVHGQMDIGRIYCEEFHSACYSAYAYGYTHVNLAKTLTQEGDEYCAFNIVLRPENLPGELRSACFAEYDPYYTEPDFPKVGSVGKEGFKMLCIKLYFHILSVVVSQLGEEAANAVDDGLESLACCIAKMLQTSATSQGRTVNGNYIQDNIPLDLDTMEDPMWEQYSDFRARERMSEHFCENLRIEIENANR